MRDAANPACSIILDAALLITEPAALNATVASTNVTCAGGGDGTITITAPSGGYGTYEYSINGGGSWQASGSFTGLVPGNYNVQMRDGAQTGCVKVLNSSLSITQPAILTGVVGSTMVTCNGADDGIITITSPSGGSGSYEYSTDGGTTWQASGTFTGLAPATYDVRIRDAVSTWCVIVLNGSLTITEPVELNANVQSTNVTCNGANDGIISVRGADGTPPYDYTLMPGAIENNSTGDFFNIAPGAGYYVSVTDANLPSI